MRDVTQSVAVAIPIRLSLAGVAVTGLVAADVAAKYRKAGAVAFTGMTLSGANLVEVSDGWYDVTLAIAEVNTLGYEILQVSGATIDTAYTEFNVIAATAATSAQTVDTCIIYGNVNGLDGLPAANVLAKAKILSPVVQGGVALTTRAVSTTTDANGYFSIALAQLADVELYVPDALVSKRFTVPAEASKRLWDIP